MASKGRQHPHPDPDAYASRNSERGGGFPLAEPNGLFRGQIKRLVRDRGFGFLFCQDTGKEYFFHRSVLVGLQFEVLDEGDDVQFRPEDSSKGPRAGYVTAAA